jgi:hypothetical protein
MGGAEGEESTVDARELVRRRLRAQLPDRRSDRSTVNELLADRKADLLLERDPLAEPPQA